jgi:glutathione S-transferase
MIMHVAHRSDWEAACGAGSYSVSSRDTRLEDVGFIHGSYAYQLPAVAEHLYADDSEEFCVVLLDAAAIRSSGTTVIDEDGGDGEL